MFMEKKNGGGWRGANSELAWQAGGFCWRMSARTSGETERGFGKKAHPRAVQQK